MKNKPVPTFRPHILAPVFSNPSQNNLLLLQQLITEVTSDNFQLTDRVRELLRQVSLTSLWFFLRYVLGTVGPYEKLNDDLHLDMCNFRQSDYCMTPGAKAFCFIARGYYKTSINTHGALTWELTRDPDLTSRLTNAIQPRAVRFMRIVEKNIDSNEFYAWLFSEHVPNKNKFKRERWNDKEMVMPSRTRHRTEPSVMPGGCEGSGEGDHFSLFCIDDLLGLDDLDVNMMAGTDMYKKMQWFKTNHRTLLEDWNTSRIVGSATRYGLDDVYQWVVERAYKQVGFPMPGFKANKNGEWVIYYRAVREEGEFILPEIMNEKGFTQMLQDDPWTVQTQYFNDPQQSGLTEFKNCEVKDCILEYQDGAGFFIIIPEDSNYGIKEERLFLSDLDVTAGADPAGTKDGVHARICQSAICVFARDWYNRYFLLWNRHGFWGPHELFDEIFRAVDNFKGYIRTFGVESNAMQKIIIPLLNEEKLGRDLIVNFQEVRSAGKKDPRIRNTVGLPLQKGQVYATKETAIDFIDQKDKFPMAKYQKDILDAAEMAMALTYKPDSPEEVGEYQDALNEFEFGRSAVTGY